MLGSTFASVRCIFEGSSGVARRLITPVTLPSYIYTLVAEKRQSKHDLTGCEEIWVGRSITTPWTDLAIPISWVGSEVCYELWPAIHVHGAKVFDKDFPLRFGPDALRDASQGGFNGFMDDFTYQLYGSVVDDADIATRTQGTTYLPGEDRDSTYLRS